MPDRIEINPQVCGGKPVIRGTRIPISIILDELASGSNPSKLVKNFPELSESDIRAALEYASTLNRPN